MWFHIKRLEKKVKHRATLQACERCGFYYPKKQDTCHHCAGISDEQVLRSLARKRYFRTSLGRAMFVGAALILLLMYLL
jgi:hypothetical protein